MGNLIDLTAGIVDAVNQRQIDNPDVQARLGDAVVIYELHHGDGISVNIASTDRRTYLIRALIDEGSETLERAAERIEQPSGDDDG